MGLFPQMTQSQIRLLIQSETQDTSIFASAPVKPEVNNIYLNNSPPIAPKEDTITELILHNTMQTLASKFKRRREPKIQKFRGNTSSGVLLVFKSWMQDIESTVTDRNINTEEASKGV